MRGQVQPLTIAIRGTGESVSTQDRVTINKLTTGVSGLDEIVGGGLPEFSFNIIAGAPGSGKTTLAHQFVFANATPERPCLLYTSPSPRDRQKSRMPSSA